MHINASSVWCVEPATISSFRHIATNNTSYEYKDSIWSATCIQFEHSFYRSNFWKLLFQTI